MRALPLLLIAFVCLLPLTASAFDPSEAGKLTAEIEEKQDAIRSEYGDTKNLTREQRKEMNSKLRAARSEVLTKHGVSEKEYATGMLKLDRSERKQMERASKEHRAAREAAAKKAGEAKSESGEVQVQRGFDDKNPISLDDPTGVQVQRGGGREGIEIPIPAGE